LLPRLPMGNHLTFSPNSSLSVLQERISTLGSEETSAGRFAGGVAATTEGAGGHHDGGRHTRIRNRSYNRHLYPCAPGNAEVAASDETGRALEDRRQSSLLQLGRLHPGR